MEKYKANIDTKCSFCQFHTETCQYTEQLWKNIGSFNNENIQQDVSITFKGCLDIMSLTLLKAMLVLL